MPSIRYDPNKPGDRKRACSEELRIFVLFWGSGGSLFYYIDSLVALFKGNYSKNIFYSSGLLAVIAILDFFLIFHKVHGKEKKNAAKSFFLFFVGGALDLAGVIAVVHAIHTLCHKGTGTTLLISSLAGIFLVTLTTVLFYLKTKDHGSVSTKLFTDKKTSFEIDHAVSSKTAFSAAKNESAASTDAKPVFCRFCCKKLPDDSAFCPYCGQSLQTPDAAFSDKKSESQTLPGNIADGSRYAYYKKKAANMASYALKTTTILLCYTALAVFLLFNIKMAPFYGWRKFLCYTASAGAAIGIVSLMRKKIFTGESKRQFVACLSLAILVMASCIGLRILYESKLDYAEKHLPSSGNILVSLSESTTYYNLLGIGIIQNPSTDVKIEDTWYTGGDILSLTPNKTYAMRIRASGSENSGYADGTFSITASSFSSGKYTLKKEVYFSSGPAELAEVSLTFTRHCTFWEVVLC